ncbi:MAG: DJ-1/PfpI family protein [Nanoarchaeota archaeon]
MSRVLILIAPKNFQDHEFAAPRRILSEGGHTCTVLSTTHQMCTGKFGMEVLPDLTVNEVDMDGFEALVLIGGPGAPLLAENQGILEIIRCAEQKKKIIAAICIAPILLAAAGILRGHQATVYPAETALEKFKTADVLYTGDDVTVDRNIITANGPAAAEAFAQQLLKALEP